MYLDFLPQDHIDTTPLSLGQDALNQHASTVEAMRQHGYIAADIVMASMLQKIESGSNHSELKGHLLWLAKHYQTTINERFMPQNP